MHQPKKLVHKRTAARRTHCSAIPRIGWMAALAYLTGVVFLVFTLAPFVSFACKVETIAHLTGVYVLCAFVLGAFVLLARKKLDQCFRSPLLQKCFTLIICAGGVALFVAQVALLNAVSFRTGWDVEYLVGALSNESSYRGAFSRYPNQLFLLAIFKAVSRIGSLVGFSDAYFILTVGGALCVAISVVLIAFSARFLAGTTAGYATFFLGAAFLGLSPWIAVPYSDAWGMLCPSLVLFLFTCIKNQPLRLFGVTFFSIMGFFIKPTAIFILVAILFVSLPKFVQKLKNYSTQTESAINIKSMAKMGTSLAFALLLSLSINTFAKQTGPKIDEDQSFSATHFLMMGFNPETKGVYWGNDVHYSGSFPDQPSRQRAELEEWHRRVLDLGVLGCSNLFLEKTLTNFGDGTFAWEIEGRFYKEVSNPDTLASRYFGIGGQDNFLFRSVSQTLWFFILIGIVLCWLIKKPNHAECAIAIALLMLGVFLTLFEARARYLFLYAPYFILLGVLGWQAAFRRIQNATHALQR